MAKQTFTVGQVLTAAQLTSLQQTAMLGGAASAKTASYTLVAADAGTTISMTSTSATTVTVNTGLFAAGDTVFIQNLGSGNLTITAGTATVATAGSLILPQNDAGILYFVSTSSSVFYDFIQVGAASPLTTKGDLYTFSTSDTRLGVGANGTTLVADSSEATGLKWATASSGGMTLIASGSFAADASVVLSSIVGTYRDLSLRVYNFRPSSDGEQLYVRLNADTGNNYVVSVRTDGDSTSITFANRYQFYGDTDNGASTLGAGELKIINYSSSTVIKGIQSNASGTNQTNPPNQRIQIAAGLYNSTTAITSITMLTGGGTITSGSYQLLGIN